MNTPIMVPLDGSTFAEHALTTAMDLTCWTGQRLHAVRVHVPTAMSDAGEDRSVAGAAVTRAEEERYLREIADQCATRAGLAVRTALVDGPIATALATYVQDHDIGMVIMTSHGRGGISRTWLGSVADALVRRVRVPVLMLRPCPCCGELKPLTHVHHIVVPVDGSDLSARILGPAARFGAAWDARLTLLHLLPAPIGRPPDDAAMHEARDDAELVLDELAAPLRARGHRVDVVVLVDGHPANAILDYAATHHADAIAMATRGRGGWDRIALGSVADKVLRGSVLPVLLYRPSHRDAAPVDSLLAEEPAILRAG
jgi:nucleotide-binding universal stress UspA family protein